MSVDYRTEGAIEKHVILRLPSDTIKPTWAVANFWGQVLSCMQPSNLKLTDHSSKKSEGRNTEHVLKAMKTLLLAVRLLEGFVY